MNTRVNTGELLTALRQHLLVLKVNQSVYYRIFTAFVVILRYSSHYYFPLIS